MLRVRCSSYTALTKGHQQALPVVEDALRKFFDVEAPSNASGQLQFVSISGCVFLGLLCAWCARKSLIRWSTSRTQKLLRKRWNSLNPTEVYDMPEDGESTPPTPVGRTSSTDELVPFERSNGK